MTTPGGGVIATVYVRVLPEVQRFATELRRSLRASSRELRRMDREIEPVNQALQRMAKIATGIVPGIRLVRAGLLTLGGHAIVGGILSVASAAETLSGALLTLPAIGVAAASGMGALAVGLFGVQDALKQFAKNEEKFNDKVDGLSENAQKALGVLEKFRDKITDFRNAVQDRLFAGMDDVARGLLETFLPLLENHFGNLVDIINGGAKDLAAFAQSGSTLRDVGTVTDNIELGFTRLRTALIPAATAFRDLVVVGSTFLPQLASELAIIITHFATWISQMRATGQLRTFIQNGIDTFKQLLRILGNVGRALHAVFQAGQDSGNGFLDTLETLTEKVADFLESTRGQDMLRSFFDSARGAGEALAPVLIALADLLLNHIAPILEMIAKAVGPAVAQFFTALGDGLEQAAPSIKVFALGFAQFIQGLIPAIPAIASLVASIANLVGILAGRLGPVFASIINSIANILIPIFSALSAIFLFLPEPLLHLIVVFGSLIVVLATLITVIRGVQTITGVFAGGLKVLAKGFAKTEGAATGLVGFLSGPWGIAIGLALTALGLFLAANDESAANQQQFRDAAREVNDAIREQNGIINENVRVKAAQSLEEAHLLAGAKALGLSTRDVTNAYLEQGDSLDTVRDKLQKIIDAGEGGIFSADDPSAILAQKVLDDINALVNAKHADADATRREADAAAAGISPMAAWGAIIDGTRFAIDGLTAAQLRSQQVQLDALNSSIAYQNQLARTADELAEGTRTLDLNTQEGRDNLSSITALIQAGNQHIADLQAQHASYADVTAAQQAMESQLLDLIGPFFANRDAARAFLVQLGLIPDTVTVTILTNIGSVLSAAQSLANTISHLPGAIFGGIGGHARGGPVRQGEWTWVGEEGPELVRFGRAARVYSNDQSEGMVRDVSSLDTMTGRRTGQQAATMMQTSPNVTQSTNVTLQPQLTARVYIGDRELTDIVRVELADHDAKLVKLVTTGAGKRR